jgi:hypothetical protein
MHLHGQQAGDRGSRPEAQCSVHPVATSIVTVALGVDRKHMHRVQMHAQSKNLLRCSRGQEIE